MTYPKTNTAVMLVQTKQIRSNDKPSNITTNDAACILSVVLGSFIVLFLFKKLGER